MYVCVYIYIYIYGVYVCVCVCVSCIDFYQDDLGMQVERTPSE